MKLQPFAIAAAAACVFVSCKEKSAEVKQVEAQTAKAVESGALTKEQADQVNKAAHKADELKADTRKLASEQLEKLNKADTVDEKRAAIKDATKANVELAVKAGLITKDQADLSLKSLESIDSLPEPLLNQTIEQLKASLQQAQAQP